MRPSFISDFGRDSNRQRAECPGQRSRQPEGYSSWVRAFPETTSFASRCCRNCDHDRVAPRSDMMLSAMSALDAAHHPPRHDAAHHARQPRRKAHAEAIQRIRTVIQGSTEPVHIRHHAGMSGCSASYWPLPQTDERQANLNAGRGGGLGRPVRKAFPRLRKSSSSAAAGEATQLECRRREG